MEDGRAGILVIDDEPMVEISARVVWRGSPRENVSCQGSSVGEEDSKGATFDGEFEQDYRT